MNLKELSQVSRPQAVGLMEVEAFEGIWEVDTPAHHSLLGFMASLRQVLMVSDDELLTEHFLVPLFPHFCLPLWQFPVLGP